jgi:hypothetical protein
VDLVSSAFGELVSIISYYNFHSARKAYMQGLNKQPRYSFFNVTVFYGKKREVGQFIMLPSVKNAHMLHVA